MLEEPPLLEHVLGGCVLNSKAFGFMMNVRACIFNFMFRNVARWRFLATIKCNLKVGRRREKKGNSIT